MRKRKAFAATRLTLQGIVGLVLALWPGAALAQRTPAEGPADPREVETFLEPIVTEQMQKLHIPGVVFVLVKDGRIFFVKGWGYADLEKKKPVLPDQTLFRVASLSKLFAATAIMQLAERGKLYLNDDVNNYLKRFHLEKNFAKPVTIANLLTHTGGFDERFILFAARGSTPPEPLGEYLARRMPPRVMAPGEFISYSNHGYALLGHAVEEVSRVPFAQYVDEHILQPLGMKRSSFLLPPGLASDLAVGYRYENGRYRPWPFDYVKTAPASQMIATATDVARFMIAHLQHGRFEDARILEPATAQEMHRQHFTNHPRLPGWCYGFSEHFENNLRAIAHGGDWGGFGSLLLLLPEKNIGIFFSYNNGSQPDFSEALISRFLDHYYPAQAKHALPQGHFNGDIRRFAGSYQNTRRTRRSLEKIVRRLTYVTANTDGSLTVNAQRYVQVEPLLFERADGKDYLAFREDKNHRITHMFSGTSAFEKLRWYETRQLHWGLMGFFALVFLSACLGWPLGWVIRRWRSRAVPASPPRARRARLLAGLISALNLLALVGFVVVLPSVAFEMLYRVPPVVTALLSLPLVTSVLTIALLVFSPLAWKEMHRSFLRRLHFSLVSLAALAFIPFLLYWNLLGFRY